MQTICVQEEAAHHYGETYSTWIAINDWIGTFIKNWPKDTLKNTAREKS